MTYHPGDLVRLPAAPGLLFILQEQPTLLEPRWKLHADDGVSPEGITAYVAEEVFVPANVLTLATTRARRSDPDTSKLAALTASTTSGFKALVLLRAHMLAGERGLIGREHEPATGYRYEEIGPRRANLRDWGYVQPNGAVRQGQAVWVATPAGGRYWWDLPIEDRAKVTDRLTVTASGRGAA